ncbi:MAG: membrane lipoprotein lipid attachment site-containing protein [Bacilli bacterium]|nr:membrane lipoprotein lipid attachment site-containing protein [Bacilli bacterium]MDD4607743.1 membrane lipoprotein lipid attachment site-containing protein [Bacilli bacterium]
MKKILYLLGILVILTGCDFVRTLSNTPTKKVEQFLSKYQTLDKVVTDDLDTVIAEETNFNSAQRTKYRDIIEGNYQKLNYQVKEEEIDGDNATVTVEIEVIDAYKIMKDAELYLSNNPDEFAENDEYSVSKFTDYRLDKLKEAKEKVKYTLELTLTKVDDEWFVDDLSQDDEDKINGMYQY